jgi:hypothetical protein
VAPASECPAFIVRGAATISLGHPPCHLSDMAPMPGNIVAPMLQGFPGKIAMRSEMGRASDAERPRRVSQPHTGAVSLPRRMQATNGSTTPPKRSIIARRRWFSHQALKSPGVNFVIGRPEKVHC